MLGSWKRQGCGVEAKNNLRRRVWNGCWGPLAKDVQKKKKANVCSEVRRAWWTEVILSFQNETGKGTEGGKLWHSENKRHDDSPRDHVTGLQKVMWSVTWGVFECGIIDVCKHAHTHRHMWTHRCGYMLMDICVVIHMCMCVHTGMCVHICVVTCI